MAPFTSVVTAAGAAGSIASTPSDLVRWARALYGGDVLDTATARDHGRRRRSCTADEEATVPYGLGVQAVTFDGHPTLGHSGRLLGFRAVVRWLPRERIAIAVLTNQSRTDPAGRRALSAPDRAAAGRWAVCVELPRRRPLTATHRPLGRVRPVRSRSGTDGSFPRRPTLGHSSATLERARWRSVSMPT